MPLAVHELPPHKHAGTVDPPTDDLSTWAVSQAAPDPRMELRVTLTNDQLRRLSSGLAGTPDDAHAAFNRAKTPDGAC